MKFVPLATERQSVPVQILQQDLETESYYAAVPLSSARRHSRQNSIVSLKYTGRDGVPD